MGSSFSKKLDVFCGVPQGSIPGPLLSNIDICDLFFIDNNSDVANYVDDATPYECAPYYGRLKESLEMTIYKKFDFFKYNNFKANATKCHFFLSLYQSATVNINDSIIKRNNSQKRLGVTIDSNFIFEEHINSLRQKSSQKLHTLSKISQYVLPNKKRNLFKTSGTFQINYCPLVWMCHSRTLNNRINDTNYRALRIVYQDKKIKFWRVITEGQICLYQHEKFTRFSININI